MGDEAPKLDLRFDIFKAKIASGFPKLAGAKLDKLLAADEIRFKINKL